MRKKGPRRVCISIFAADWAILKVAWFARFTIRGGNLVKDSSA